MFDFLKKKIGGFIDGLTKKKEGQPEDETKKLEPKKIEDKKPETKKEPEKQKIQVKEEPVLETKIEIPSKKHIKKTEDKKAEIKRIPEIKIEKKIEKEELILEKKPEIKKIQKPEPIETVPEIKKPEPKKEAEVKKAHEKKPIIETKPIEQKIERLEPVPEIKIQETKKPEPKIPKTEPEIEQAPKKERIKLGIISTVKSIISRDIEITENDVKQMLDDFELELLEADVEMSVAESIRIELNEKIVGAKVPKGKLQSFVSDSIKSVLIGVLTNEKAFDMVEKIEKADKPVKIMLIGINGAGKTTTIAKIARLLMDNKKKVVFAAADTFRAAAIEQMGIHAERLGVKMIKREYGSDPTSVAYDAVNYAKAHEMDVVLIDTAGRQDTNISLINEVKKMSRVIQPDLKIYIGESIAGNAIIEQISTFNKEMGIDAVILTKLDCDPKGGTMLSINKATGIPIIYIGTGQKYEDLEKFDPEKIVDNIIS